MFFILFDTKKLSVRTPLFGFEGAAIFLSLNRLNPFRVLMASAVATPRHVTTSDYLWGCNIGKLLFSLASSQ